MVDEDGGEDEFVGVKDEDDTEEVSGTSEEVVTDVVDE